MEEPTAGNEAAAPTVTDTDAPAAPVRGVVFGYGFDDDDHTEGSPSDEWLAENDGEEAVNVEGAREGDGLVADNEEPDDENGEGEGTAGSDEDPQKPRHDEQAQVKENHTAAEKEDSEEADANDPGESARRAAVRLSELEASDYVSSGRYSYQLRLATHEAETLSRFIRTQQQVDEAATRHSVSGATATESANGEANEDNKDHTEMLSHNRVRVALAKDPRVATALLMVARADAVLVAQSQRVAQLRRCLADGPTSSTPSVNTVYASSPSHSTPGEPSSVPRLLSFEEVRASVPTREELPDEASRGLVESAAVMKSLLQALPFLQTQEKRRAVERVLVDLGHLVSHTYQLLRYESHLHRYSKAVAQALPVAAAVAAEERGLMAAQALQSVDVAQLASATTLAEARAVAQHAALQNRLTDLQAALAAVAVAKVIPTGRTTIEGSNGISSDSVEASVSASAREAVEADVRRLTRLHEALDSEVRFLRKEARRGVYGNRTLTGRQYDLLLDATADAAICKAEGTKGSANGALGALTHELVEASHKRVADLIARLVPSVATDKAKATATISPSTHLGNTASSAVGDASGADAGDMAPLLRRVLRTEERVASRHTTLAALVAANARLVEEIRTVELAAKAAAAPERATQLAYKLMEKLGFSSEDGEGGGEADGETTAKSLSLADIECGVLEVHAERVRGMVEAVNAHLSAAENVWLQPERDSRAHVAFLLRMLAIEDQLALSEHGQTVAHCSDTISRVVASLTSASTGSDDEDPANVPTRAERLLATPVPVLPLTNAEAQHSLRTRVLGPLSAAATSKWGALQSTCQAAREEIAWYEQYAVEEVPQRLASTQLLKRGLLQRTLDAGQRSKHAGQEKQRAAELAKELAALEESARPPLVKRVEELRAELVRLQGEYAQRVEANELAREAAEAERQLREGAVDAVGEAPAAAADENAREPSSASQPVLPNETATGGSLAGERSPSAEDVEREGERNESADDVAVDEADARIARGNAPAERLDETTGEPNTELQAEEDVADAVEVHKGEREAAEETVALEEQVEEEAEVDPAATYEYTSEPQDHLESRQGAAEEEEAGETQTAALRGDEEGDEAVAKEGTAGDASLETEVPIIDALAPLPVPEYDPADDTSENRELNEAFIENDNDEEGTHEESENPHAVSAEGVEGSSDCIAVSENPGPASHEDPFYSGFGFDEDGID